MTSALKTIKLHIWAEHWKSGVSSLHKARTKQQLILLYSTCGAKCWGLLHSKKRGTTKNKAAASWSTRSHIRQIPCTLNNLQCCCEVLPLHQPSLYIKTDVLRWSDLPWAIVLAYLSTYLLPGKNFLHYLKLCPYNGPQKKGYCPCSSDWKLRPRD